MADLDPATVFAPRFNALGAPWATTAAIASGIYGEIRTTLDIDIIILLDSRAVLAMERPFPEPGTGADISTLSISTAALRLTFT